MKLYVRAKSKKELNERLAAGKAVFGENYSVFEEGGMHRLDDRLRKGTVIAIYERTVSGSPLAKSYGTWQGDKVS